jgi:GGDEF domain-containing protein
MRAAGNDTEARKAHLAYGVVLRDRGEYAAARREFRAAEELAEDVWQRLTLPARARPAGGRRAQRRRGRPGHPHGAAHPGAVRVAAAAGASGDDAAGAAPRRAGGAQGGADRTAAQDALTGLGNRRQFDRQIATVDESYALVLIDVDHFKTINDTFSHQTGDRILTEVATVLRAHCRAEDTAGAARRRRVRAVPARRPGRRRPGGRAHPRGPRGPRLERLRRRPARRR